MPRIRASTQSFPIAGTFTIARGSKTAADVILVEASADGMTGRGEGVPYARYTEDVPQALAALAAITSLPDTDVLAQVAGLGLPKAAQNALDCALLDLAAKRQAKPIWQILGLPPPKPVITAYTLSLGEPKAMADAARRAAAYPLLKIKLGRDGDEERLAQIRAAVPQARLIVDANEGWRGPALQRMLDACARCGVEMVEQPLPQGDDEELRHVKRQVRVCADESAHDVASLAGLVGKYDVINIKLDKTGGLTPALALRQAARARGFKIMVGCMLGSSLAMAPAFYLAQDADYVDLDGPLLLAKDRENPITYLKGAMHAPEPALWG